MVFVLYLLLIVCFCFFFFSSRRRHTRYWRDWSSDVCSSDLYQVPALLPKMNFYQIAMTHLLLEQLGKKPDKSYATRSEERRVGKSVDLGGRRIIKKKKK